MQSRVKISCHKNSTEKARAAGTKYVAGGSGNSNERRFEFQRLPHGPDGDHEPWWGEYHVDRVPTHESKNEQKGILDQKGQEPLPSYYTSLPRLIQRS